jgi:excisionase family DNA binding protein
MLTIKQTAERFGLPEHFLRQLVKDPNIVRSVRVVRAGAKYLINCESLAAWLSYNEEDLPHDVV